MPGAVGVPAITPFVGFSLRSGGRFPPDSFHVSGCAPPVTPIFDLVNDPTVAGGSDSVVILSGGACAHNPPIAPRTSARRTAAVRQPDNVPLIVSTL